VEDGDVRTGIEGLYGYRESFACVKFYVPKSGTKIKTEIILHMNEASKMVKLSFNTINGEFIGQTAFGTEMLSMEGKANVFQKFSAISDNDDAFIIINDGIYGGDYDKGQFNQVLLRTTGYSAHPLPVFLPEENLDGSDGGMRYLMPDNRYLKHIDMGVREFSFEFYGDKNTQLADYNSAIFNEKPYALCYFPSGDGKKSESFIIMNNKTITLSAFKKAYDNKGYIIRLYNSLMCENKTSIKISCINLEKDITFKKFEVKTFRVDSENNIFEETDLIERMI